MASTINAGFFQLVAAFFIAFILAHMATRYMERFERFPSPLVSPGPEPPAMIQGRAYIPHGYKPTAPPGPAMPMAMEVDPTLYGDAPLQPKTAAPGSTRLPALPYPMNVDDYLSFVNPESAVAMSTIAPPPASPNTRLPLGSAIPIAGSM